MGNTGLDDLRAKVEALEAREAEREAKSVAIQERPAGPGSVHGGEPEAEEVGDNADNADVRDPDKVDKSQVDERAKNKDDDALSGWFPFRVPFFDN